MVIHIRPLILVGIPPLREGSAQDHHYRTRDEKDDVEERGEMWDGYVGQDGRLILEGNFLKVAWDTECALFSQLLVKNAVSSTPE